MAPVPGMGSAENHGPASRISVEPFAATSPARKPPPDPAPQITTSYVSAMSLPMRAALILLRPQISGHRPTWRGHHYHRNLAMTAQRARDGDILLTCANVLESDEASRAHLVSPAKGLLGNPSPV